MKDETCCPEEDLRGREGRSIYDDLDKHIACKQCVKCGSKTIDVGYMEKYHDEKAGWVKEYLLKTCQCGYAWVEDCLDKGVK